MDISKKLLNVNEAATALGLRLSLVYTLIRNGRNHEYQDRKG